MDTGARESTGIGLLVFAAISHEFPEPPDVSDHPPLHVFAMSIGVIIGKLLASGRVRSIDAQHAMTWLGGKKSVAEMIELIWNTKVPE